MKKEGKTNFFTYFVVIISALAGCLYGLDIGAISGALKFIAKEMDLSSTQQGMIVGAVLGGGSVAILITGVLADIFGRKKMIVISAFIFLLGVFLTSMSFDYYSILVGRLVMGTGIGISSILIPLYLSEAAPAKIRGRAVTCFQLFLTGGILLAYLVDLAFTQSGNWRAMFGVLAIPGAVFMAGVFFIPESPVWLFTKGMVDKSKNALLKFNTEKEANKIVQEMDTLKEEKKKETNHSILQREYVVPFLIAFLIAALTQATGINCILQYAPTIFKDLGANSDMIAMELGTGATVINFIITIIALMLIDKLGRKPLLIISTGGTAIFLALMGFASINKIISLLTVGMFGFVFAYGIGIGVIVWLATSELLPTKIRSKGLAICLFTNSMVSTVLAAIFPDVVQLIGYGGVFFILCAFTVVYFIIALFFLPETKGKTVEEIEMYFRGDKIEDME